MSTLLFSTCRGVVLYRTPRTARGWLESQLLNDGITIHLPHMALVVYGNKPSPLQYEMLLLSVPVSGMLAAGLHPASWAYQLSLNANIHV